MLTVGDVPTLVYSLSDGGRFVIHTTPPGWPQRYTLVWWDSPQTRQHRAVWGPSPTIDDLLRYGLNQARLHYPKLNLNDYEPRSDDLYRR